MQHKVLIVEDDIDIANLLVTHISELGLEVHHAANGAQAMKAFSYSTFNLVLLDIMLPDTDGLTLCRELKMLVPDLSIMLVTSKSSEIDRVLGLEMGADDYICKPFSYRELQARVKTQLRHLSRLQQGCDPTQSDINPSQIDLGLLTIDPSSHEAWLKGESLELTATEFDLLHFFAQHPNQVFSRAQLLESVWGYQHSGYEHTVNSHINRLRNKLVNNSESSAIETVWGVGYKLNPKCLTQVSL